MDHSEINLDVKQNNRRHSTGRYGVKTNKTVKKQQLDQSNAKKSNEIIKVVDVDNNAPPAHYNYQEAPSTIAVSLNKRRNWETVNNLKKSADDINYGYRVVEIDNYTIQSDYSGPGRTKLRIQLYELDKAPPKEEQEVIIESGVNRKGHFVREKRRKGKKGVKNYNTPNNNHTNTNNNDNSSSSDSEEERSGEDTSDQYKLYVVQKRIKNPASIRSGPFYGCTCTRTCHCGKDLSVRKRRDVAQDVLDINAL